MGEIAMRTRVPNRLCCRMLDEGFDAVVADDPLGCTVQPLTERAALRIAALLESLGVCEECVEVSQRRRRGQYCTAVALPTDNLEEVVHWMGVLIDGRVGVTDLQSIQNAEPIEGGQTGFDAQGEVP